MIRIKKIAKLGSVSGIKGHLKLYPDEGMENLIKESSFLFLKVHGNKVPFKIQELDTKGLPWILKFEDVNSPEQAKMYSDSFIFLEADRLEDHPESQSEEIIGFKVMAAEEIEVGEVIATEIHPEQILLVIQSPEGEFRLPFHPDLIEDMDPKERKIRFSYTSEDISLLRNIH